MIRLALVALLSGCAAFTFTEAECRGMNWHQRGYADGYGGHPPQDLRLARECGRVGVQVSQAHYLEGWRAGYDEWYRLIGSMGID
jgi:hypothetical protein